MTTDSLNDYSTTPALNTNIAGTSIAVGCPPADVGTYMRTAMAQLAYAVQGSGGTIPATWHADLLYGALKGTTTNDSAAAGNVGEFVSSTVLVGGAVALAASTATNITSISLTAGDWDVSGNVAINPAGTTVLNQIVGWVSSASATLPTAPNQGGEAAWGGSATAIPIIIGVGPMRFSLSGPATIYLSTFVIWTTNQPGGYGFIRARRVR
jgi:hypothetical protein